MSVQFEDNSMFIIDEIEDAALKFLEEASGELESQVKRIISYKMAASI